MDISIIQASVGSLIMEKKRAPKKLLSGLAENFTAGKNTMGKWLSEYFLWSEVSWQSKPVTMLLDSGRKVAMV